MLRIPGVSADAFQKVATEHADDMQAITERSKEQGAAHHAFYESDGEVVVIDEWDSPESFQKFFESEQPNIGPLIQAAGGTGEPTPTVFRRLDSGDAF